MPRPRRSRVIQKLSNSEPPPDSEVHDTRHASAFWTVLSCQINANHVLDCVATVLRSFPVLAARCSGYMFAILMPVER